jgi:glycerate kinase
MGKAPVGVAAVAQRHQVPVVCLSGGLGDGADEVLSRGIGAVASIVPQPMALEACISQGAELIEAGAARMCRLIRVGMGMH